jgi:hypothetical protein
MEAAGHFFADLEQTVGSCYLLFTFFIRIIKLVVSELADQRQMGGEKT